MAWVSWAYRFGAVLVASVPGCADDEEPAAPAEAGAADRATAADAEPLAQSDGGPARVNLSADAVFVGVCTIHQAARDPSKCTGLEPLLACSASQCGVAACKAKCADFVQCLANAEHRCAAFHSCDRSDECTICLSTVQACTLALSCFGLYTCAAPTIGGACTKLEACCASQRSPLACTMLARSQSILGGDPACEMLSTNPGFVKTYASDPPCAPQP